jgi:hypothetical protein
MAVNTPPKARITKYRELGDAKLEVVARELTFLEIKNGPCLMESRTERGSHRTGSPFPPLE